MTGVLAGFTLILAPASAHVLTPGCTLAGCGALTFWLQCWESNHALAGWRSQCAHTWLRHCPEFEPFSGGACTRARRSPLDLRPLQRSSPEEQGRVQAGACSLDSARSKAAAGGRALYPRGLVKSHAAPEISGMSLKTRRGCGCLGDQARGGGWRVTWTPTPLAQRLTEPAQW